MRKKIIIGNWKMTMTNNESLEFVKNIRDIISPGKVDVVFCPSYTAINEVRKRIGSKNIKVGAQNVHFETAGAYTGEINVKMLQSIGVSYVIIGHSERRIKLKETDELINKKIKLLLAEDITPILCVGENIEERLSGTYIDKIEFQIRKALEDVDIRYVEKLTIAYEPVWAISTSDNSSGLVASKKEVEEVAKNIRYIIEKLYGLYIASKIRILYGGSVSSQNSKEILETENIDGLLVGAKSTKPDIIKIVEIANKI